MLKYIGKRVLLMIPVVLGISFILFTIMEFSPGDPARIILGDYATQEQVDELEALLDSGHARRAFAVTPMDW